MPPEICIIVQVLEARKILPSVKITYFHRQYVNGEEITVFPRPPFFDSSFIYIFIYKNAGITRQFVFFLIIKIHYF